MLTIRLPASSEGLVAFQTNAKQRRLRCQIKSLKNTSWKFSWMLRRPGMSSQVRKSEPWRSQPDLRLVVMIPQYYLVWWLRWCRTFTITGRVVCPDGRPVPGATVCAYDIDFFWWWVNKQSV